MRATLITVLVVTLALAGVCAGLRLAEVPPIEWWMVLAVLGLPVAIAAWFIAQVIFFGAIDDGSDRYQSWRKTPQGQRFERFAGKASLVLSCLSLLTGLVFVVLQCAGVINWSWWLVLAPIAAPFVIGYLVLMNISPRVPGRMD